MVNINKVRLQIRLKRLNKCLSEKWYKLMKPLAKLIDKIEKNNYDKFCKKSESMSIVEVSKRLSNLIIKELVRHSGDKRKYTLEFEVAGKTIYDEDGMTFLEYMKCQHRDKNLRHWAYMINDGVEINKELSELLIYKNLEELKLGLTINKFKNSDYEEYCWKKPKDYLYTIQISL